MRYRLSELFLSPGPIQRGIAVFFLIFTSFDILFIDMVRQQGCSEDAALQLATSTLASSDETAGNKIPRLTFVRSGAYHQSADPGEHKPAKDPAGGMDEDCFCCCSHIIPGFGMNIATLNYSAQPDDHAKLRLPASHPRGTYHPPRLS
jgi:hypothetical protein